MMTVKTSVAASNGLRNRTESLPTVPPQSHSNNSSNESPPTPPNGKSPSASEAKKGSRFSFSVDSLLSTVVQTKKTPTPPSYSAYIFLKKRLSRSFWMKIHWISIKKKLVFLKMS